MKSNRSASAFTLVEVMIVVAIIGLLAAISIPNYVKSRETTFRKSCMSNLRQLEGAVQSWALETKKASGDPIASAELFGSTNYLRKEIVCPAGGSPYRFFNVGDRSHVQCVLSAAPDNHTLN
jgi:prepilin-type N-terminal cleavage/methylation domain-containing protein